MGQLWDIYKICTGQLWGIYGAAIGYLWGRCGAAMGQVWGGATHGDEAVSLGLPGVGVVHQHNVVDLWGERSAAPHGTTRPTTAP